jgi:hypothetical protein
VPARKKPQLKQGSKQYIQATRWQVEDDYRHTLSDVNREYLDRFNEAVAGDNPQYIYKDKKTKRALWKANQKVRRDAMAFSSPEVPSSDGTTNDSYVRANQEDVIIEMLDSNAQPYGQNLKDRVRARRESREFDEACAKLAAPKIVIRRRKAT